MHNYPVYSIGTISLYILIDFTSSNNWKFMKKPDIGQDNQEDVERQSDNDNPEFILPNQTKGLKSCRQCGLVKTSKQWQAKKQCQNCGQFTRLELKDNISGYDGLIGIIDPYRSFVRRRAKIYPKNGGKLKSGVYGF